MTITLEAGTQNKNKIAVRGRTVVTASDCRGSNIILTVRQQVTWLVVTEIRSESFGLLTERRHYNTRHSFHRQVWCRALSLRYACIRSSGIILVD